MAIELQSAAVSVMNMGEGVKRLLHEFLSHYFDGTAHVVGGEAVTFPKVDIVFDQGGNEQPLPRPEIRVVMQSEVSEHYRQEDGQQIFEGVTIVFAVRMSDVAGKGKEQAGRTSDLLYGLMQHKGEVVALARKGIHNLMLSPGRPISDPDFHRHLLVGRMRLIMETTA